MIATGVCLCAPVSVLCLVVVLLLVLIVMLVSLSVLLLMPNLIHVYLTEAHLVLL